MTAKKVLGGLHHEYRLESRAAQANPKTMKRSRHLIMSPLEWQITAALVPAPVIPVLAEPYQALRILYSGVHPQPDHSIPCRHVGRIADTIPAYRDP